jgi:uncharacterized protein with HEPN domain
MLRDARELLEDMLTYSLRCQRMLAGKSYLSYCNDDRTRLAVERSLGIVGEALIQAVREDAAILTVIPDAQRIMNFRHRLIHSYYNIDDAIIWSVVEDHLPGMQQEVEYLLNRSPNLEQDAE